MGAPVDLEPHEALEWCIARAAGEVAYCDEQIAKLDEAAALGRPTVTVRRNDGDGETLEVRELTPALHSWIVARREALDRLARFAKMAADAGVDERRVRIAEAQADRIADVFNHVVKDLVAAGLPEALRRVLGDSVRRHIALLDAVPTDAVEVPA